MDKLPQEILLEIIELLDVKSAIKFCHRSKSCTSQIVWPTYFREQAIKMQPILSSVAAVNLNWKVIALHAFYSVNNVNQGLSTLHLERLLTTIRADRKELKWEEPTVPVSDQQKAREIIRGMLNDVTPVVLHGSYIEAMSLRYRAPVLYWICNCQPTQREDRKFIAELALDEVLKNTTAVNVPALAMPHHSSIDWPINAVIMHSWKYGVERLLQVEDIALDVLSTAVVDGHQLRVLPLHCAILSVTSRKVFREAKNFASKTDEDGYRFKSTDIFRPSNLAQTVIPLRERGLTILKLLLTRVNPNHHKGVMSRTAGNLLIGKNDWAKEENITALHLACYYQAFGTWIDAIKVLIEAGADVNAQTNPTKLTPLHMLFANIHHTKVRLANEFWSEELELSHLRAVVELFLAHGADLSLCTTEGMNVIHYALVAHKRMSFDESIIITMQQHCARAALESLPWSVCLRCYQRYNVSANDKSACAIHLEAFDERGPYNLDATDTFPCCGGAEDSSGCALASHR